MRVKQVLAAILPSVIVMGILSAIFMMKGIYPFGPHTICYADIGQIYIPIFCHIYDVLHGAKDLFWDFYTGAGVNMYGSAVSCGAFSPLTWLLALGQRESITYNLSYILMLRMALIAFTSSLFFRKAFPSLEYFWQAAFSVMYACGGYVLIYYTNITWLDYVILFPLLMLSLRELFEKDRTLPYVLVVTANLLLGFYVSFMVVLFVFFASGILLWLTVPAERRNGVIIRLGAGTLAAVLLSAFVTLPVILQVVSSARAEYSSSNVLINGLGPVKSKIVVFLFASVTYVLLARMIFTFRQNKRAAATWLLLIAIVTIQVVVENINRIWHCGNYICFPFRYGFIPTFMVFCACGYYLSTRPAIKPFARVTTAVAMRLLAVLAFAAALVLCAKYYGEINRSIPVLKGLSYRATGVFVAMSLLFGFCYWVFLKEPGCRLRLLFLSVVMIGEIICYSMWHLGVGRVYSRGDMVYMANGIRKSVGFNPADCRRVKDCQKILNDNYPLVLEKGALGNYTGLLSGRQQKTMERLGYSHVFTRIVETGGTLFSDALLGIQYAIARKDLSSRIYVRQGHSEDLSVYAKAHEIPFGMTVPEPAGGLAWPVEGSPFDTQNAIYRAISGKNTDILETSVVTAGEAERSAVVTQAGCRSREFEFDVRGEQLLYFFAAPTNTFMRIVVNGAQLAVPTLDVPCKDLYPARWNNGIMELGLFKDEKVRVRLELEGDGLSGDLFFAKLALSAYSDFISAMSPEHGARVRLAGRQISYEQNDVALGKLLFLPVSYDEGWACRVNGTIRKPMILFGSFLGVKMDQGKNDIEFRFVPRGLWVGLLASFVALVLTVVVTTLNVYGRLNIGKGLLRACGFIYWFAYGLGCLCIYIIPAAAGVIGLWIRHAWKLF